MGKLKLSLPLEETAIRALLPHQGEMCLIDRLSQWSPEQAVCESSAHLRPAHPLSGETRLGSASLIEVAAQAMALHGALLGSASDAQQAQPDAEQKHGVLAGVRKVVLHEANIALIDAPLRVDVTLSSGDSNTALYAFDVSANGQSLASGRATVLFTTQPQP
ncbi:MAG: hydroxymyristoyl-ACP dehydratase [Burkholderiaceae bacterium]